MRWYPSTNEFWCQGCLCMHAKGFMIWGAGETVAPLEVCVRQIRKANGEALKAWTAHKVLPGGEVGT